MSNRLFRFYLLIVVGITCVVGCSSSTVPITLVPTRDATTPTTDRGEETGNTSEATEVPDLIVLPVARQIAPLDIQAQVRWFDGGAGGRGPFCPIREGSPGIQIVRDAIRQRDTLYEGDPLHVCAWGLPPQSDVNWELESSNGGIVTGTSDVHPNGITHLMPDFSYLRGLYQIQILSGEVVLETQFRLLPSDVPKIWVMGNLELGQTITVYYAGFESQEVITTVWYLESAFDLADYWASWQTTVDTLGRATETVLIPENAGPLGYSVLAVKSQDPMSKQWSILGDSSVLDLVAADIEEIGSIQSDYPSEFPDDNLSHADNSSCFLEQVDMGTIDNGETRSGVLGSILEAHNWTFRAQQGKFYHFQASFQDPKRIAARVNIINPDGELVYECGRPYFGCENLQMGEGIKYKPDVSGDFIIRLDKFNKEDGAYSLSLDTLDAEQDNVQQDIIIDDLDEGLRLGGPSAGWRTAPFGYKGQTHWTYCTDEGVSNWGQWIPQFPVSGDYEVFVFVPEHKAGTKQAQYRIFHNGVDDESVVRQADYANEWVSLGTYEFAADGEEYVYLDDNTGEARSRGITIGFDAVKFVYIP